MKKFIAILLAILMVLSLAACSPSGEKDAKKPANPAVEEFVEKNKDSILSSLESSFTDASSGLTCTSSIQVEGSGFVIHVNINELEDTPKETKDLLQETYDALTPIFEGSLEVIQKELPELEYFTVYVCEKDGDVVAKVHAEN